MSCYFPVCPDNSCISQNSHMEYGNYTLSWGLSSNVGKTPHIWAALYSFGKQLFLTVYNNPPQWAIISILGLQSPRSKESKSFRYDQSSSTFRNSPVGVGGSLHKDYASHPIIQREILTFTEIVLSDIYIYMLNTVK